jgi:acetylornithine deacetylase/succinyl-diaminopimelate desuccinylase-like protein
MNSLEVLKQYLRYPSISADPAYKEGMQGASRYMEEVLQSIGFFTELVKTAGHPLLYAKRGGNPEWPHVLLYGHYDVQPVDPVELWRSEPFQPTQEGHLLYARGSADNKGPFVAHLAGLYQALQDNPNLPVRISVILEGEEEVGSPSLPAFLQQHREELAEADFVLLSDTCSPSSEQIAVTTGLRGLVTLEFSLVGPASDLHSGLFGGPVVNPLMAMAKLLAKVHDEHGRITIPGFYDDVLPVSSWEQQQVALLGVTDQELARKVGASSLLVEPGMSAADQIRMRPTFEINGLWGGYNGEGSKTVLPSLARAKISCRLVPNQKPQVIGQLVADWLCQNLPVGVKVKVESGHGGAPYSVLPPHAPGSSVDENSPLGRAFHAVDHAVVELTGNPVAYLREGGSIPIIADFKTVLGLDSLMIGLFTPESGLHAPNENMDLRLFERGIEISRQIWHAVAGA